jgi:hypothetical protein
MAIEVDDEYISGVSGAQGAASLYMHPPQLTIAKIVYPPTWQKELICGSSTCRRTHTYTTADLRLYDA